jgi:dihydroorotate dehydrogenase
MLIPGNDTYYGRSATVPLRVILEDLDRHLVLSKDASNVKNWLDQVRRIQNLEEPPNGLVLAEIVKWCLQTNQSYLLTQYGLPHPTYNQRESFIKNALAPLESPPIWRWSGTRLWNVLGFDVRFPIGVPASVITPTSNWIEYYSRLGFNILTYKTVRSEFRDAHPEPNWVFLEDLDQPLSPGECTDHVTGDPLVWPRDIRSFSTANSFGVPSFDPEFWQSDFTRALGLVQKNQLLIASVMGTFEKYKGEDMVKDFVRVARMAEDAGAVAIELNLSCPNTVDPTTNRVNEMICDSAEVTQRITSGVRETLNANTRLIVKLGYMPRQRLESVVRPIAEAGMIDGVAGINTVAMKVVDSNGESAFPNRDRAGVSGVAIREFGLQFVGWLAEIRQQYGLTFDIIGMGGVMNSHDVVSYMNSGAAAVQAVTAAFLNPYLAREICEDLIGFEAHTSVDRSLGEREN